jgi:hypothetical protein
MDLDVVDLVARGRADWTSGLMRFCDDQGRSSVE